MAALASSYSSSSSSAPTRHIRLSSIAIDSTHNHGAISIGRLESIAPFLGSFDRAFDSLTHLALNLRDWRRSEDGFRPFDASRPPFVVRFLAKARNLHTLRLSCFSTIERDVFASIATHCRFEKLVSCQLAVMSIPHTDSLSAFLRPANESLAELCLKQMELWDPVTTWAEWLASLASAPKDDDDDDDNDNNNNSSSYTVFPRLSHICAADLIQEHRGELRVAGRSKFSFEDDWRPGLRDAMEKATTRPWYSPWGIGDMQYPFLHMAI